MDRADVEREVGRFLHQAFRAEDVSEAVAGIVAAALLSRLDQLGLVIVPKHAAKAVSSEPTIDRTTRIPVLKLDNLE